MSQPNRRDSSHTPIDIEQLIMNVEVVTWLAMGRWEVLVHPPHTDKGKHHVHVRRRRGRKGEYSWNSDGTRHDNHKFPVSEGMIKGAKQIAGDLLKIDPSNLEFVTAVPSGGHVSLQNFYIPHDFDVPLPQIKSAQYFLLKSDSLIVVSDAWFVIVSTRSPYAET